MLHTYNGVIYIRWIDFQITLHTHNPSPCLYLKLNPIQRGITVIPTRTNSIEISTQKKSVSVSHMLLKLQIILLLLLVFSFEFDLTDVTSLYLFVFISNTLVVQSFVLYRIAFFLK